MPVTCPHCETRYVLPEELIGPGGARVRCPRCREPFSVGPDGAEIAPVTEPRVAPSKRFEAPAAARGETIEREVPGLAAPVEAPLPAKEEAATAQPADVAPVEAVHDAVAPAAGASHRTTEVVDPRKIAQAVLDDLASHSGEAIAASHAQGKLFREFGAVIAEAFEFYRRQAGPGADPAPFRAALKDRWGVDLEPGHPSGRLI